MLNKMPVIFVGHGSPMNAIEDNIYSRTWKEIAEKIPKPKIILSVSAHWFTRGIRVSDAEKPEIIYDMYGFPEELYRVSYAAPGAPETARETVKLMSSKVEIDNSWGIDHGIWSVLCRMYPEADIPVFQLSVDQTASAEEHFKIGKEIGALREKGVLILGSGNVVHNLSKVNFGMQGGYPWAETFDGYIKDKIIKGQYKSVIDYRAASEWSEQAFHTPEHFYPLLFVLGASRQEDKLTVFNNSCTLGALSMTGYLFE